MTSVSHICFSSVLLCFAFQAAGANVTGKVELTSSRDPNVSKHHDYSGVVIWLEPLETSVRVRPRAQRNPEMVQRHKSFVPHVLAVNVGERVNFPNYDPIFHNAFSNYEGQIFDVSLYPPGTTRSVQFRREGIVRVFCNIHPAMSAVIVVLRSPYFAASTPSGAFTIPDVPPGPYRLHVFHERAAPAVLAALSTRIDVPAADLRLPPLSISESGYVQLPHKNKYGKEYPKQSEPAYSGATG